MIMNDVNNLKSKLNNKIEKYLMVEDRSNEIEYKDNSEWDIEERIEELEGVFDLKEEYKKVIESKSKQEEEIIKNIDQLRKEMERLHQQTKNQIISYEPNYNKLIDKRIKLERIKWDERTRENPKKKAIYDGYYQATKEEWEEKKMKILKEIEKEEEERKRLEGEIKRKEEERERLEDENRRLREENKRMELEERKRKEEEIIKGKIIAKGRCGDNVNYEIYDNGKMFIYGNGDMNYYEYGIPWCSEKESIEEIIIENGVSSLGCRCFEECSNLSAVSIPSSVKSIENECFSYCSNLKTIIIPTSVKSIGDYCFRRCSNLIEIVIPKLVPCGNNCFDGCPKLKKRWY